VIVVGRAVYHCTCFNERAASVSLIVVRAVVCSVEVHALGSSFCLDFSELSVSVGASKVASLTSSSNDDVLTTASVLCALLCQVVM
jgi:hypothetical protein